MTLTVVRGIRGATTVDSNTADSIFTATKELVESIIGANELLASDVSSVFLTMTEDLNADFPAKAIRSIPGWQWVPLMCAPELSVPGALPMCIRVLLHVNTARAQEEMQHVYLGDAKQLRPDVVERQRITANAPVDES